jgi:hypothetical protein
VENETSKHAEKGSQSSSAPTDHRYGPPNTEISCKGRGRLAIADLVSFISLLGSSFPHSEGEDLLPFGQYFRHAVWWGRRGCRPQRNPKVPYYPTDGRASDAGLDVVMNDTRGVLRAEVFTREVSHYLRSVVHADKKPLTLQRLLVVGTVGVLQKVGIS